MEMEYLSLQFRGRMQGRVVASSMTTVLFHALLLSLLCSSESIVTRASTIRHSKALSLVFQDDILIEVEPYAMRHTDLMSPCESTFDEFVGAETLDGRLLCAAECAYGTRSPYFNGASFHFSTVVKRITRGVNSVLVGKTRDGVVIAFRGTVTSSPYDWLQNAALYLSDVKEEGIHGKIHGGFYGAVKSLWGQLKIDLLEMLESCDVKHIYITGHSKGGAMASIAAMLLARDLDLPNATYVCTFASARVGNAEFRDQYNKEVNQTSYENHLDLIPFLPPSQESMDEMNEAMTDMVDDLMWSKESKKKRKGYKWGFRSVGRRRFIDENGSVISPVDRELDNMRIREFEKQTILSFRVLRAAHCCSCPDEVGSCSGGYFRALAPEVCTSSV